MPVLLSVLFLLLLTPAQPGAQSGKHTVRKDTPMFQLTSKAFAAEGSIPVKFTCQGSDISPNLAWTGAPAGTKSFALIMHDPDAPRAGGFTHWVLYNIPAGANHIAENLPKQEKLVTGGVQGTNDGGSIGYMGPCPPSGAHRYYIRLYALDSEVPLQPGATKAVLEKAITGHILAEAELMGRYSKSPGKVA
jgi:hypothetical protein